jgi:cytoskeletal protein CcmA (bactofilin family)
MKKALLLAFMLIGSSLLPAAKGKQTILVAPGTTHTGNINAFRSTLDIAGKVEAAVFLVGGRLQLSGEISGDVICLGSQVEIKDGAVIGRDLIVIGGHLDKAPGCKINGEFYYVRTKEDLKKIARTLLPFLPESGGLTFFKISKIFFWFILVMLTLLLLPVQVNLAAVMLKKSPLRYLAVGLLTLLIFILLLLIFSILSLVLIGIPLLLILIAAYFLALIFGRAVLFYFIGSKIASFLKLKGNAIFFVILGTAIYALLKFIPWFGVPLLIIMDILVIGIGVGFFLQRRRSPS